jgi:CDP-glycerol glycerophosphotransferase (TagB/SpsB family)
MKTHNEIAYYIDFSIHEIPFIVYIAYETGGIIYTDSEITYNFFKKDYPELQVKFFSTTEKIKEQMFHSGVKVIIYPDYHIRFFKDLGGVKHVQLFHGPNDKRYQYRKDVLDYDLFFISGNDAYEIYRKKGLLKKGTGRLIGYPKLDRVFREEIKRDEELIKLGLDPIKKTALYAPTWSDKELNSSWKKFKKVFMYNVPESINLIIKLHPNLKKYREHEVEEFSKCLEHYKNTRLFDFIPDTVQLMTASDVLIGDVSGVTREFLAFKRPFVFLSNKPKWLWNKKKIKFWECGDVVTDPNKLWQTIEKALEEPDRYLDSIKKYFKSTFHKPDGKAAERAKEAIFNLIN